MKDRERKNNATSEGQTLEKPRGKRNTNNTKQKNGAVGDNKRSSVKDKKKEKKEKKNSSQKKKDKKKSIDGGSNDDGYSSHGEHTTGGLGITARSTTASNMNGIIRSRDAVREDVMNQVLKDYHAKPTLKEEVAAKPYRWPCYGLRRLLGLAHVELHDAVLNGNIEIVKATILRYIQKYPRKINEHDQEGRTALSLALMEDREDIADFIISVEEADVNNADLITGLSPLHGAVLLDLESSAQKLAYRGAHVNATDKVGMTPLMLACRLGHESLVEMLVDVFGAELDPEDQGGWTCLFYATFHNEVSIAQKLLERGADPEHRDKKNMKAIDWGEYMDFGNICSLFEQFKAQLS